jgi:FAD/FMN-containing dehydrogenase/Fe-S oxidoreductase
MVRRRSRHERDSEVDAPALARSLAQVMAGEVRFDAGSRALYATDASNYRQIPLGVIIPRDAGDVGLAIDAIRRRGAAVLGRGGGTSLAGQSCNDGVVIDFSKYMHGILSVDSASRTARVQPGVVLDKLREAAAPHGLTFGPDPATHEYCTIGGMIGNNSCGVRSVMAEFYGPGPTTAHSVEALDILLYDGTRMRVGETDESEFTRVTSGGGRAAEIYRAVKAFQERYAELIRREFPRLPRRVSGYNLPALLPESGFQIARALVGSEATLALVLEATVRLIPAMPHRTLVVLGYADVFTAADHVPDVRRFRPVGLEGFDAGLVQDLRDAGLHADDLRLLPDGAGWLLVEFGADSSEESRGHAEDFAQAMRRLPDGPTVRLFQTPEQQQKLWVIRESGLAATARVSGRDPTWPGWEDSAVPPERLGTYLRELRALMRQHGYEADLYGHFGQGCVHCRIDFDLRTADGIRNFRSFVEEAADLVHRHGGSLSGEHGDGQARGELLPRMFGAEMMQAFHEFKAIWDPDGRMNPGKILDAYPVDSNLRLGTDYDPKPVDTWFRFPEDLGSFAHATLRCVGVGKCRRTDSGTMCPSYMVTREEKHSTRGRAQLLFEMLEGDPLTTGWEGDEVAEALDLCLACKGCKGECPVQVDMATYKAEFRAHYYRHRWRPRSAHAFGRIGTWARLVARLRLGRLANAFAQTPGVGRVAKWTAGMAPARDIPAFAPQTFRQWFRARAPMPPGDRLRVILWTDTFNDHFHPETLVAATEVLEATGFHVSIPEAVLCCGRPLYDFGILDQAKARLQAIMAALDNEIRDGVPVVGIEPGCLSVFRDELVNLYPDSESAHRLRRQSVTLAELLDQHADRLPPMRLERRAIVHGHCHHTSVMRLDPDRRLLERTGLALEVLDSGCCGMAGAFGFERDHYDVSMAAGERVLLPAVRRAPRDALIVADGFSCREQIAQSTDRRALHLAEVLRMAMQEGPRGPAGDLPERGIVVDHADARLRWWQAALMLAAAGGLLMAGHAARRARARAVE